MPKLSHETSTALIALGDIEVKMGLYKPARPSIMAEDEPGVTIYAHRDVELSHRPTLPEAITYAYNAVRVCRPDLCKLLNQGDVRESLIASLVLLGRYAGVNLKSMPVPVISTRMYIGDEAGKRFASWHDRPEVRVKSKLSTLGDRNTYNDGIEYQIILDSSVDSTSIIATIHCPSWDLPDLQAEVDRLAIRHFTK